MQALPEPQLDGAEEKVWRALSLQETVSIDTLLAKAYATPNSIVQKAAALIEPSGRAP